MKTDEYFEEKENHINLFACKFITSKIEDIETYLKNRISLLEQRLDETVSKEKRVNILDSIYELRCVQAIMADKSFHYNQMQQEVETD